MRVFIREKIILLDSINPNQKIRRVQVEMHILKFVLVIMIFLPSVLYAINHQKNLDIKLKSLVNNGSVLVANDHKVLYRYPSEKNSMLIPASVLKVATALAAMHYLGHDFRFKTDFFLSNNNSLIIRGRGDPFLVSETLQIITKNLKQLQVIPNKLHKLFFDTSLFSEDIQIPGIQFSRNPYDARNGSLVVNFNTVFIKVESNGIISSAEKQTPLTPLARRLGKKLSIGLHRISLPHGSGIAYASELIQTFFLKQGFTFEFANISIRPVNSEDHIIYTHVNEMTLSEIIAGMMRYSNNFTANQLLLSIGLKKYGAPATLLKGNLAVQEFLRRELKIPAEKFVFVEGSGISRKNRMTPEVVLDLLRAFSEKQYLLHSDRGIFLKTGTLRGVYTMAGYLPSNDSLYFVILLNQQRNNRDKILDLLLSTDFSRVKF